MSCVKQRLTPEQRLSVKMTWYCTKRETYSAEFIAVAFDVSRPTVLELCVDVPRVGDKFIDHESLRAGWTADRQRKSLGTTDRDWALALIKASEHAEHVLTKSTKTLQVLLEQAHSQAQRIAA